VRLVFSPQAVHDLQRLHDFIFEKNPQGAKRVAKSLRQGIARLRQHPQLGRRVRQAPDQWAPEEMRDWVTGDYVARYLLLEDTIVVLRIWHGRENRP
jgi:plasmid stabilization system protein ParE